MSKHYCYSGAILLIIACFFLSGCAAIQMMAGKRSPQYDITNDLAKADASYQDRINKGRTEGKGPTGVLICSPDPPTVSDPCVAERVAYLDYQQNKYNILLQGALKLLNETDIQAGYGGIVNVSLTVISGAIGIAIASLSAASVTGNAVWIAGLGAGASGIGIFQGVFQKEAIDKDALQKYKEGLANAAGAATIDINFPQWRVAVLAKNDDWTKTVEALGKDMNTLQKAVLFTFQDIKTKPTTGGDAAKTPAGGDAAKTPAGGDAAKSPAGGDAAKTPAGGAPAGKPPKTP